MKKTSRIAGSSLRTVSIKEGGKLKTEDLILSNQFQISLELLLAHMSIRKHIGRAAN